MNIGIRSREWLAFDDPDSGPDPRAICGLLSERLTPEFVADEDETSEHLPRYSIHFAPDGTWSQEFYDVDVAVFLANSPAESLHQSDNVLQLENLFNFSGFGNEPINSIQLSDGWKAFGANRELDVARWDLLIKPELRTSFFDGNLSRRRGLLGFLSEITLEPEWNLTPQSWLPKVLQSLDDSTAKPGETSRMGETVSAEVAYAARLFFQRHYELFRTEPHIFATKLGDIGCQIASDGLLINLVISPTFLVLFDSTADNPRYCRLENWADNASTTHNAIRQFLGGEHERGQGNVAADSGGRR